MIIDPNPIPVLYTDEEISLHVKEIIASLEIGDNISFKRICTHIIQMAKDDGKLKHNTEYMSTDICSNDKERISVIMWEMILDRKVITVFGNNYMIGSSQENPLFKVLKK